MKPFELAFKWIKDQYNKYIAPIVDTVKNFDIGQTAKDMWESTKNFLGFSNDTPKAAIATQQYADNNRTSTYNGGDITNTYNITTQNPEMVERIMQKQNQLNLAAAYHNVGGGY